MKKWKKLLAGILAIAMMLSCAPDLLLEVHAEENGKLVFGDYKYKVNEDGSSVTITKYTGKGGEVDIPSEIEGKKVTSIGDSAFSGCSGLTSVTIPDSVTSIGEYVFSRCNRLKSATIPNSVTSIGGGVFMGCGSLTSITIPDSVTSIGSYAFYECSGLESITIPNNVTSIGAFAFVDCNFASIVIPDGVTSIEAGTFRDCCLLRSITIPDSVTSIEGSAFAGCFRLTSITIPDSVTSMGEGAFKECSSLTSITIPDGVTSIADETFYGCNYLSSIAIPDGVTNIGEYAFSRCERLISVTIPNSVTSIWDKAFGYSNDDKIKDFIICGVSGSEAERYAKDNGFTFNSSSGGAPSQGDGKKVDISKASVTLSPTSYAYDGKAKTPSVTVKLDGKTLALNTDYTVSYSNNINVGTAKATVTGKGSYTGSTSVDFTIVKAAGQPDSKITCKKTVYKVAYGAKPFKINATSKSKMAFTSSKPKIAAVDKNTGRVTIKNTGVATITIKAGKASKKVTIKVSPKKPSVKSVKTAKGKKLTVKWAKDKMASGYQVQVSTDKKFKKNVKSKSLPKTSYTFTKLKTGKKYYVRIRSYKKSGKETLYSAWSKVKVSGKIKK